jgi:predicted nucleotidyltransferase
MSSHEKCTGPIPLSKPQLSAIADACQQHHVARLHAFGSVLRADYRPGESDIDLLVEFQPLQPIELADAYFGLEQQLHDKLGLAVDLVMASALRNPIVRADIEASKRLIYEA